MLGSHFHWTPCLRTNSTTVLQTFSSFAGRCPISGCLDVAPGFFFDDVFNFSNLLFIVNWLLQHVSRYFFSGLSFLL
jgi:hypothetical protein